jgi:Uncharacterized conserved protein
MIRILFLLLGLLFWSLPAWAQTYQVDPAQSKIEWTGKKVTGKHSGVIPLKSGTVVFEEQKLKGGNFIVNMQGIQVVDLKDSGPNAKLTNHLKSEDFFSVATHPESQFKITSVKQTGPNAVEITGDLTIKGITHPWTVPATVSLEGDVAKAKAQGKVDRSKYDVRYGSGKFFQGLGDKLIYDDFDLAFDLTAKKQ